MEFGDITRTAGRLAQTANMVKLERNGGTELPQEQVDSIINDFYGNLLVILYERNVKRPQDLKNPHLVKKFSNRTYRVVIDLNPYAPEPSDQKIILKLKNKKDTTTETIEVFRPKPDPLTGKRTGGNFTVNGVGKNTKNSTEKLKASLSKMERNRGKKQRLRFGKRSRTLK